ncbi:hypothetical protein ACK3SF_03960 [Candidatus Nanosalina sp. VS9-1]|uniref:hypothetical protein n=1 Tax=Candidatus Nanosalina sp. VS9-1 TaxID=3388566 RepID=UPI0039DFE766
MSKQGGRTPSPLKSSDSRLNERIKGKNEVFKVLLEETFQPTGFFGSPTEHSEDTDEVENGVVKDAAKSWFDPTADTDEVVEKAVYFDLDEWEDGTRLGRPTRGRYISQKLLAEKTDKDQSIVSKAKHTFNSDEYFGEEDLIISKNPPEYRKEYLAINTDAFLNFMINLFEKSSFKMSKDEKEAFKKFLSSFYNPESIYGKIDGELQFLALKRLILDCENLYSDYQKREEDEYFQELYDKVAERLYEEIYEQEDKVQVDIDGEKTIDDGEFVEEVIPFVKKFLAFSELEQILNQEDFRQAEDSLLNYISMRKWGDAELEVNEERRDQIAETIVKEFDEHDAYNTSTESSLKSFLNSLL